VSILSYVGVANPVRNPIRIKTMYLLFGFLPPAPVVRAQEQISERGFDCEARFVVMEHGRFDPERSRR
jgi:hypothetical protein